MTKAFTLLELIIVIICIGILAVLAFIYFNNLAEKSRISEAKLILTQLYEAEWEYYERYGSFIGMGMSGLAIDPALNRSCSEQNNRYFSYDAISPGNTFVLVAYRCIQGGKFPPRSPSLGYQIWMYQNGSMECKGKCP